MSPLHFFKLSSNTTKLPDPHSPLSTMVPLSSIESANTEVKRVIESEEGTNCGKRGHYEKFLPELRFEIGTPIILSQVFGWFEPNVHARMHDEKQG